MNILYSLLICAIAAPVVAAELPVVPTEPIAKKKELLFADDFSSAQSDSRWHKVVETFSFEKGTLKGMQTRDKNIPAADGKPAVTAHHAVHGLMIPTRDSVVECKIRLEGATMIDVEFDDRQYAGSHYGHICRAQVRTNGVTILDERDGNMRNDIYEMKKPEQKVERAKLLVGHQVTYPLAIEQNKWYVLVVETVGDSMRVTLDGKAVAFLKSSGIGHTTKSKIEVGVGGKAGLFDDFKVWTAEPTQ